MLDLDFQLAVIEGSGRMELLIEGSRLFTDPEHLSGCRREQTALRQGISQTVAFEHLLSDLVDARRGTPRCSTTRP